MSFYEFINKHFAYSNVRFHFISGVNDETFVVIKDNDIYSIFDMQMNLVCKDLPSIYVEKGLSYLHVKKNKPNECALKILDERNKLFNVMNFSCDNSYFVENLGATFLGVIHPDEYMESISVKINEERFIPVSLFNSRGPNLTVTTYQNARGRLNAWIGDSDEFLCEDIIQDYPWVLFFHGNDDASYYSRFKTYYDALTAWEVMKENDCIHPQVEYNKKTSLQQAFEQQTHDKLFYFFYN